MRTCACTQTTRHSEFVKQDRKDQPLVLLELMRGSRCVVFIYPDAAAKCPSKGRGARGITALVERRWGWGWGFSRFNTVNEIRNPGAEAPHPIGPSNTSEGVKGGGQAGGWRGVKVHLLADTAMGGAKPNGTKELSVKGPIYHTPVWAGPGEPFLCSPPNPPSRGR